MARFKASRPFFYPRFMADVSSWRRLSRYQRKKLLKRVFELVLWWLLLWHIWYYFIQYWQGAEQSDNWVKGQKCCTLSLESWRPYWGISSDLSGHLSKRPAQVSLSLWWVRCSTLLLLLLTFVIGCLLGRARGIWGAVQSEARHLWEERRRGGGTEKPLMGRGGRGAPTYQIHKYLSPRKWKMYFFSSYVHHS